MEITINVKGRILLDASPELERLLQRLSGNSSYTTVLSAPRETSDNEPREKAEPSGATAPPAAEPAQPDEETITVEELRAVMCKVPKEEARALIQAYGVVKLTDIPEKNWPEVMASAKAYIETKEVA